jgi:hypothetical protein
MTSDELLAVFRNETTDTVVPYLWSDAEFYGYLDDAQKQFCKKTDGIPDATSAFLTLAVVADDTDYLDLDPSILKIRGVARADTGRRVDLINFEDLAASGRYFDGRTGPLQALVTGEERHKCRPFPVTNESVSLKLLVFRLPLVKIEEADQTPEIDEDYHLSLLHWCKHRAYSKPDADAYDPKAAASYEGKFLAACADAKILEARKVHKPRSVAYGGY